MKKVHRGSTKYKEFKALMERLEKDILYDAHSLHIKIGRSEAFSTLKERPGSLRYLKVYILKKDSLMAKQTDLLREDLEQTWLIFINSHLKLHKKRESLFDTYKEAKEFLMFK